MISHELSPRTRSERSHERVSEWLGDALRALPFVLGLLIVAERQAHAYTDPGTGALIWQMVAAGFVGLMFYLRKFTTWFKRTRPSEAQSEADQPSATTQQDSDA